MSEPERDDLHHLRERRLGRTPIYAGRLLRVFEDTVELPGGQRARREVVEHRGAVAIVAVTDDGRVVLVRQWRHAVELALWELPAGTRNPDEEPTATAPRELTEETGYSARRWSELGRAFVSPGYSRELIWFYLAEQLVPGEAANDPDERLDVSLAGPSRLAELVAAGEVDCKTLAGLAMSGLLPRVAPRPM